MKKIYLLVFIILISGCDESYNSREIEGEARQIVTASHIENYFIKDKNHVFTTCEEINNEILANNHSGYESSLSIYNISYTYNFKWRHSGEIMYVGFYCDFKITHYYPIYTHITKEYSYRVDQYVMRKHYEGNRLKYLSFE